MCERYLILVRDFATDGSEWISRSIFSHFGDWYTCFDRINRTARVAGGDDDAMLSVVEGLGRFL